MPTLDYKIVKNRIMSWAIVSKPSISFRMIIQYIDIVGTRQIFVDFLLFEGITSSFMDIKYTSTS